MEIATSTEGDLARIAFTGHLDTNTSPQAQEAMDRLVAGRARTIVVDFTALEYISSAGLRVLLATVKRIERDGGTFHLFGLNDSVREVFEISGFSTILKVFGTEAEALRGLTAG